MPRPSHPDWSDHSNNILWTEQIMKLPGSTSHPYSQVSESCPALLQWSPSSWAGGPDWCAGSHVTRWASRWSYSALWWPETGVETASDRASCAATPSLRYPWRQIITETRSNTCHGMGAISLMIQTHSHAFVSVVYGTSKFS
jgi:hypothetical protein